MTKGFLTPITESAAVKSELCAGGGGKEMEAERFKFKSNFSRRTAKTKKKTNERNPCNARRVVFLRAVNEGGRRWRHRFDISREISPPEEGEHVRHDIGREKRKKKFAGDGGVF